MKKSEIHIRVSLDDHNVPEKIEWDASDVEGHNISKAMMLSLWDDTAKNTLRIDLWTKDMMVDDMKQFFHQNLLSMADTLERATSEKAAAQAMRNFAQEFGEKLNLVMKNPLGGLRQ